MGSMAVAVNRGRRFFVFYSLSIPWGFSEQSENTAFIGTAMESADQYRVEKSRSS
jgi:hypothetical protein